jgi:hypothetical protein
MITMNCMITNRGDFGAGAQLLAAICRWGGVVSQGVPAVDGQRPFRPVAGNTAGRGEAERLARRDLLILRLEMARRRRRLAHQVFHRLRPTQLAQRLIRSTR